jgi:hypothetical protein
VSAVGALPIGLVLGIGSYGALALLRRIVRLDDTLDVFAVHGVGGALGSLALGFQALGFDGGAAHSYSGSLGALRAHEGQLGSQLVGLLAASGWSLLGTHLVLLLMSEGDLSAMRRERSRAPPPPRSQPPPSPQLPSQPQPGGAPPRRLVAIASEEGVDEDGRLLEECMESLRALLKVRAEGGFDQKLYDDFSTRLVQLSDEHLRDVYLALMAVYIEEADASVLERLGISQMSDMVVGFAEMMTIKIGEMIDLPRHVRLQNHQAKVRQQESQTREREQNVHKQREKVFPRSNPFSPHVAPPVSQMTPI